MRKLLIGCLVLTFAIGLVSCEDDDATPANALQYDGPNFSGPELPAGRHELAVRFTENELNPHLGKDLEEISFYVGPELPAECRLFVYGEGTNSTPGTEIFEANVTNAILPFRWNNVTLPTPIEITGEDIWISVQVEHLDSQTSIGCDAGPNQVNGDWLFRSDDPRWQTFLENTGESVNWNIRGFVTE